MKQTLFVIQFIVTMMTMQAQTTTPPAVGEYYLQGVMETGSGFKLNANHSFEFFFSYGALDREGKGHWKQEGKSIIFNSEKTGPDYTLLQSKKQAGNNVIVKIIGANEHLRKMLHATIKNGTATAMSSANEEGIILLQEAAADSIVLLFEWSPEKQFVFVVPDKSHNYFEFQLEPTILDVVFDNFKLELTPSGFTGPHPMDPAKTFDYRKAKR